MTKSKSVCRACGAEIRWITMRTGKHMPVECEPFQLIPARDGAWTGVTYDGRVVKGYKADGGQGIRVYAPHWARCVAYGKTKKPAAVTQQVSMEV